MYSKYSALPLARGKRYEVLAAVRTPNPLTQLMTCWAPRDHTVTPSEVAQGGFQHSELEQGWGSSNGVSGHGQSPSEDKGEGRELPSRRKKRRASRSQDDATHTARRADTGTRR